jgi:GT2 family glycosyltransferase
MRHSVAIPSYRRPADLRRGLEALTRQERLVDQVIVVARKDDAETHRVVEEFTRVLPVELSLVDEPGVVAAYNRALDVATGDVISFVDDDAAPHGDWARKLIQALEDDAGLAGIGGRDHIFGNGKWVEGAEPVVGIVRWHGRTIGRHHLGIGPRRDVDCLKAVNMSVRMDAVGNLRMDRRLRGKGAQWHCELKFCLELRKQGKRLAYDPSIAVDHFVAPRHDEDQRGGFSPKTFENETHNLTVALLEYLSPMGRCVMLPYALAGGIGTGYFGFLQALRFWPKIGNTTWSKFAASARGLHAGWVTWREGKVVSSGMRETSRHRGNIADSDHVQDLGKSNS